MNLFGNRNNSNRPEFTRDMLPDSRWGLFTSMLRTRFFTIMQVNLTFLIFAVPFVINIMIHLVAASNVEGLDSASALENMGFIVNMLLFNIPCMGIMGMGLVGMVYVLRNWARDEHASGWGDFFDSMKENWKQGFLMGLLNGVAIFLMVYAALFYYVNSAGRSMFLILTYLMLGFLAVLAMVNLYIWPMIVSYSLKLRKHLSNSIVLALGRLPWSVLFVALSAAPVVIGFMYPVALLYYVLIGFALTTFINVSYTNSAFDRFINPKIEGAAVNRGMRPDDPQEGDGE